MIPEPTFDYPPVKAPKGSKAARIARNNLRPYLTTDPDGRRVLTIPAGASIKEARKLLK